MTTGPDSLIRSPFERLRELLGDSEPPLAPIDLALGEPSGPSPPFVAQCLAQAADGFSRYPSINGTDAFRTAVADWLIRRYRLRSDDIDPTANIIPLNGSREGLLFASLVAVRRRGGRPAILMPDPCYPAYRAAALAVGAEPVPLRRMADRHLPDLELLGADTQLLQRSAMLILCSPSNPEGEVADRNYLARAIALARRHGMLLLVDEAYSEIYDHSPPPGAIEIAMSTPGKLGGIAVFNSLSKRSNVPGLRSGFCAGDAGFIAEMASLRNVLGPQMPGPIQHVSAAIWSDEAHVEEGRAAYRAKFDLAERILGTRCGYRRPAGGFFAWLNVSPRSGEEIALSAWRGCGVRLLPGAYLTFGDPPQSVRSNPYIRMALTRDLPVLRDALCRLVPIIDALDT